jgi:D-arabinose 1-dehydrogenase-like Zn-dependent alcohol dehydrogenase|tara:strand:- start:420 stop:1067 length:648 start_codon:yes stop_codon:yes gene_type:complete
MAQFRWAYVNCTEEETVTVGGPVGSLQYLSGTNVVTGSSNLIFNTSSNTLFVTGTLLVSGTISASSFVVNQTDTISGSTIFGNSNTDTHQITGSLFVGNNESVNTFEVIPSLSQSVTLGMRHTYRSVTTSGLSSSTGDYILGFGGSGNLEFRLLSASTHNSGAILVLKDESASRTGAVTISASSPNTIDNNGAYVLTGSSPAISLYSNGSDWFVF